MPLHYRDDSVTLWCGDALEVLRTLPDESVHCAVTSPPYFGMRDYGEPGQYGLEETPSAYVETMCAVFAEVRRVLAADGTFWLNLGDSYYSGKGEPTQPDEKQPARRLGRRALDGPSFGVPRKSLLGMPWRVALALQEDGWTLRSDVIWAKTNPLPESVTDRPSCTHEHLFLLAKQPRYWFNLDPIREPLAYPEARNGTKVFGGARKGREGGVGARAHRRGHNAWGAGKHGSAGDTPPGTKPQTNKGATGERHTMTHPQGRNPGDVWALSTQPFASAHFAVMPPALAERCILAGCRPGGVVLDPFAGSGTTGMVALKHGHPFVGIDLSAKYLDLALRTRLAQTALIDSGEVA